MTFSRASFLLSSIIAVCFWEEGDLSYEIRHCENRPQILSGCSTVMKYLISCFYLIKKFLRFLILLGDRKICSVFKKGLLENRYLFGEQAYPLGKLVSVR